MSELKSKSGAYKNTRREFAKTLAAMAAAPLLPAAGNARAQEPAASKPNPPQQPPADQPSPAAVALTEVVRIRYGEHLSEEQLNDVRRSIDRGLRSADRLKQFKLQNSDEPAFVFSADIS